MSGPQIFSQIDNFVSEAHLCGRWVGNGLQARNQTVDILRSQLYVEAPLVPKSWASEFVEAQPIVVLSSALSVPLTPILTFGS